MRLTPQSSFTAHLEWIIAVRLGRSVDETSREYHPFHAATPERRAILVCDLGNRRRRRTCGRRFDKNSGSRSGFCLAWIGDEHSAFRSERIGMALRARPFDRGLGNCSRANHPAKSFIGQRHRYDGSNLVLCRQNACNAYFGQRGAFHSSGRAGRFTRARGSSEAGRRRVRELVLGLDETIRRPAQVGSRLWGGSGHGGCLWSSVGRRTLRAGSAAWGARAPLYIASLILLRRSSGRCVDPASRSSDISLSCVQGFPWSAGCLYRLRCPGRVVFCRLRAISHVC